MIVSFKIFEQDNIDIDPYGEEIWGDDPNDPSFWNIGDILICTNIFWNSGLMIGEEYEIVDITKNRHLVRFKGINRYFEPERFKLKR